MNPMNEVIISKATINIGVGEAGEKLSRAMTLIENMTGQTPVKTYSKVTNPEWGIRKRQPIACKVTLRGEKAEDAIKMVLEGINNKLRPSQFDAQGNVSFGIREHIDIPGMRYDPDFDAQGNVSFGIREHIDIPGMRYDPDIGIFGMNLSITFEKPGYRIKRRKIQKKSIPKRHRITPEETMKFMEEKFNVTIAEEEDYE